MKTIQAKKAIAGVAVTLFAGAAAAFATGVLSPASAATSHNLMIKPPAGVAGVKLQSDPSQPYGPCYPVKEREWNSIGLQVDAGGSALVAGYSDVSCGSPSNSGAFQVPTDLQTENFWYDWDAELPNPAPAPNPDPSGTMTSPPANG
jgi:hypothetical protein